MSNSDSAAGPKKARSKTKQQQQPVAQLLEDQGLNAELDVANTGGLVETERDRLIRIVSTLAYPQVSLEAAVAAMNFDA